MRFFAGSSADASNGAANTERLINMYPETARQGSRTGVSIRTVLGQAVFGDLGVPLCREMVYANGALYAAAGGGLYSVAADGTATRLADITDGEFTTLSENNGNVVITSGGDYQVWDGSTISRPAGRIASVGSAAFHGYRTLMTDLDGDEWEWTDLADPKGRVTGTANFKRNEASPDKTLRVMIDGKQAYFFGESVIEIWNSNPSGANETSYSSRLAVVDQGLKSSALICKPDNGIFFIGNDNVPYTLLGGVPTPRFHTGVIHSLKNNKPDRCFYYEDRGHKFCVIRFKDRPAWVYDIAMDEWHERSTGVNHDAWEVVATVFAYGKWFCATQTGQIYEMARNGTDVGNYLKRSMTTLPFYNGGKPFRVAELELLGEFGRHNHDCLVMLETSSDGGKTWTDPVERSIGGLAEYDNLARWHALGQHRQVCFRFTMTDPYDVTFYGDGNLRNG